MSDRSYEGSTSYQGDCATTVREMDQHSRAEQRSQSFVRRDSWVSYRARQAALGDDPSRRMSAAPIMRHHPNKPIGG